MAFRLTKDEIKQREVLVTNLESVSATLDEAVTEFNQTVAEAWHAVSDAQEAYNKAVVAAQQFIEFVHDERDAEYEEKSEKWQESASGQAALVWLEEWTLAMDEAELEAPEPLDMPDMEFATQLNELPEKAE